MKGKVLVVDDEKLIAWSLQKDLEKEGFQVKTAGSVQESFRQFEEFLPEVILLDIQLEDGDGVEALKQFRSKEPNVAVIMVTANDNVQTAVQCMKLGAFTYINKPFDFDEVRLNVEKALEEYRLRKKVAEWESSERGKYDFSHVVAESPKMKAVMELVHQIVSSETSTIFLTGESGVGKDLMAKTIHYASPRASKSFMEINCAALPATLLESELFGYEKGAFTDARQAKRGLVEEADGGTLFLDEIGDMQRELQAKLLHLIDRKNFRRVGGVTELRSDIRIIAATNKDIRREVAEGRFREDLYYRLNVIQINLPPLRERREDILSLVSFFIAHFNREFKKTITEVEPDAMSALISYQWPGNVRELRNVIERAMILNRENRIQLEHLPAEIHGNRSGPKTFGESGAAQASKVLTGHLVGVPLEEIEAQIIRQTLVASQGNQSQAARMLGIGRDALRYKMQKHNLKLDQDGRKHTSEKTDCVI